MGHRVGFEALSIKLASVTCTPPLPSRHGWRTSIAYLKTNQAGCTSSGLNSCGVIPQLQALCRAQPCHRLIGSSIGMWAPGSADRLRPIAASRLVQARQTKPRTGLTHRSDRFEFQTYTRLHLQMESKTVITAGGTQHPKRTALANGYIFP